MSSIVKAACGVACAVAVLAAAAPGEVRLEKLTDPVPDMMNVQGYLADDAGNPVNGTKSVVFKLYDGGDVLWQETRSCTVMDGLFSLQLGAVDPLPDSAFSTGGVVELELVVEGQALSPKVAVTSNGFAFRSGQVDRPLSPGVSSTEIRDAAVTMPKIDGSGAVAGYVIKWNGSSWAPAPDSAGGVSGPAGGDLSGNYPNPDVVGLRGRQIASDYPTTGDVLAYESSRWTPTEVDGDIAGPIDDVEVTALRGREIENTTPANGDLLMYRYSRWELEEPGGDVEGEVDDLTVVGIQGRDVSTSTPYTGEVLTYYSSHWEPREIGGDIDGYIYDAEVVGLQGRSVSTSSPSSGDVLTWYSSHWTPRSPFGGTEVRTGTGTATIHPVRGLERSIETFGSVELAGGRARVELPEGFAGLLDGGEFHVFLQQTSGEPVLAVARKDATGFDVLAGPGVSASFDWRAVGRMAEPERGE